MSLCENGCEYDGYNETTKKTKCVCPIKSKRNFFDIDQDKLLNKFKNYKEIINIMIVKCYKLVFSGKGLKTNIGSYILISIAVINGALIAVFYLKGFANLKLTMEDIFNKSFQEKREDKNNQNEPKNKEKDNKNFPPKKKDDLSFATTSHIPFIINLSQLFLYCSGFKSIIIGQNFVTIKIY